MRNVLAVLAVVALGSIGGCGAAPGYEEETTPEQGDLQPLAIGRPDARLASIDGANANFVISVVVSNPNGAPVTMRRLDGHVFLQEQQVAHVEVEGDEVVDANTERSFVLEVAVPLSILMQIPSRDYVARGTLYADGGSGDGSLQTPFELTGTVPQ